MISGVLSHVGMIKGLVLRVSYMIPGVHVMLIIFPPSSEFLIYLTGDKGLSLTPGGI
jgi:hypothetical protein